MVRKRKRNYQAEYAARIARLTSAGFSRPQARGHSPKGQRVSDIRRYMQTTVVGGTRLERIAARRAIHEMFERTSAGYRDVGFEPGQGWTAKEIAEEREWRRWVLLFSAFGLPEREAYSLWFSP